MTHSPTVSLVVPVYNAEKFILRCLESIQKQTFLDFEVVLVDDGSRDNSKNIIENFIENKLNWFFYSKINEGTAITRNFGIKKTTGKYITFIDIDDFIEVDYLEKLYCSIKESGSFLACCGYYDHSTNGALPLNNYSDRSSNVINVAEFSRLLFSQIGGVLWDKMFDAKIIRENCLLMNLNIYYYEDSLFIIDYLQFLDKISIVGEPLYNYNRINETSFTKKIDHTWKTNVINYNKEIEKKLSNLEFSVPEIDLIIQKNICGFVLAIFHYEKLHLFSFRAKHKIITDLISDPFLIKNFKPESLNVFHRPYLILFEHKMSTAIIIYSWIFYFLKNMQKIINKKLN